MIFARIILLCSALAGLVSGCVSKDISVREALEKDPKIVFDVIEKNPQQFVEAVNHAVAAAQKKSQEERIAQMKSGEAQDLKTPRRPELSDERRILGTAGAPINIVEYADFQCPACGMAYQSFKAFKNKYPGQVKFTFKNMPLSFHKMAYPSATYFEAIRLQDRAKALRFYELTFENQRDLDDGFLKKTAKQVGVDMARLQKDIASQKVKDVIAADMAEFEKFGFTGTPVLIVNGVAMEGAQPLQEIERVVQETKKN